MTGPVEMTQMSLRLDPSQKARLDVAARTLGLGHNEATRIAIDTYLDVITADPDFQQRLRELLEEQNRAVTALLLEPASESEQTGEAGPAGRAERS